MKRSFTSAILCLAVVAMLVPAAHAVTNVQATTVGAWTFDEKTPGNTTDGWPPTLGAIIDAAGGDNNGTAVGRIWNGTAPDTDPANYTMIWPTYDVPSTPYGSDPSSLRFGNFANNESASYAPPLFNQGRVDCPANGDANWDLLLGAGGTDYTIECVIKPEPRPVLDEGGNENPAGRTDFWVGLVTDVTLNREAQDASSDWSLGGWYMRTNGYSDQNNGFEFTAVGVGGVQSITAGNGNLNLFDGDWHHLAAVIDSTGPGTGVLTLYMDNVQVAQSVYSGMLDATPADDFPPPYINGQETTDALWLADFIGRWDDQFIGLMDGAAFSRAALLPGLDPVAGNFVLNRVPEPASIVLVVMGALALLAIRRAR